VPKILDDFDFGSKKCPKIKLSEIFKHLKFEASEIFKILK